MDPGNRFQIILTLGFGEAAYTPGGRLTPLRRWALERWKTIHRGGYCGGVGAALPALAAHLSA